MFFMEYWRDKPLSSRSESSEFYMVGKGFKAALVDRLITK
jgi:23S rRNA U2552 (ribose-2'-O)-methylase RlmE/FtsJ